jgi:hypothetical protein
MYVLYYVLRLRTVAYYAAVHKEGGREMVAWVYTNTKLVGYYNIAVRAGALV